MRHRQRDDQPELQPATSCSHQQYGGRALHQAQGLVARNHLHVSRRSWEFPRLRHGSCVARVATRGAPLLHTHRHTRARAVSRVSKEQAVRLNRKPRTLP